MGQLNLEIAQNSREIAEATLRDSSAMRTIAILTMVFLPGTAVAVGRSDVYCCLTNILDIFQHDNV